MQIEGSSSSTGKEKEKKKQYFNPGALTCECEEIKRGKREGRLLVRGAKERKKNNNEAKLCNSLNLAAGL